MLKGKKNHASAGVSSEKWWSTLQTFHFIWWGVDEHYMISADNY